MKKLFNQLLEHGPFTVFFVALIMVIPTMVELKIFNIPSKYTDGILLSNIVLTFLVYFASTAINNKD